MGTAWFKSGSLEFDSSGTAAEGALAYFYEAGTSTPLAVYSDGAETTPHEDPVEADGNGRWPLVFVPYRDTYKFVLKTAAGTTLFTADNVPNPEPFDETFEVDEDAQYQTGDYIFTGKNGTRSGAVRCNGRTIGDASSSATERANADTSDLFAYLWNNYANGQAAVSGGRGATAAADFAAHKTIALPDHRGASLVGFDDMGNTAASLLGSAPVVSGSGILAGSIIGANTHALTEAQLATHTHTGTISQVTGTVTAPTFTGTPTTITATGTVAITDPGHNHNFNQVLPYTAGGGSVVSSTVNAAGGTQWAIQPATTGITASFTGSAVAHTPAGTNSAPTFTGSTPTFTGGNTGSGTAHNILSRALPVTVLMKL